VPIHVFRCPGPSCGAIKEKIVIRSTGVYEPLCPMCFRYFMEKQPTAASVSFKGGGWAADGYASTKK